MSEVGEVAEVTAVNPAERPKGRSLKSRLGRLAVTTAGGVVMALAADKDATSVVASENPPAPTAISGVNALATRVTDARTTVASDIERLQKERELLALNKTATAVTEQRNTLRSSPTATRIPANITATAEANRQAAVATRRAEIQAAATQQTAQREKSVTKPVATATSSAEDPAIVSTAEPTPTSRAAAAARQEATKQAIAAEVKQKQDAVEKEKEWDEKKNSLLPYGIAGAAVVIAGIVTGAGYKMRNQIKGAAMVPVNFTRWVGNKIADLRRGGGPPAPLPPPPSSTP